MSGSIGLLILRLGMGGYLLTHGWGKLQMLRNGDEFGDPIGLGSGLSLVLVTFAEFLCAILVMAGLVTRAAAVPIVVAMAVAAFVAHGSDPWTMAAAQGGGNKQPALMYLVAFAALIFTGPGRFSIDALIFKPGRRQHAQALVHS
jgi:putative oxidoreductase